MPANPERQRPHHAALSALSALSSSKNHLHRQVKAIAERLVRPGPVARLVRRRHCPGMELGGAPNRLSAHDRQPPATCFNERSTVNAQRTCALKPVSADHRLLARVIRRASASASQPSASEMVHIVRSRLRRKCGSAISPRKPSSSALSSCSAPCKVDVCKSSHRSCRKFRCRHVAVDDDHQGQNTPRGMRAVG